jgi:hypothetical protein
MRGWVYKYGAGFSEVSVLGDWGQSHLKLGGDDEHRAPLGACYHYLGSDKVRSAERARVRLITPNGRQEAARG